MLRDFVILRLVLRLVGRKYLHPADLEEKLTIADIGSSTLLLRRTSSLLLRWSSNTGSIEIPSIQVSLSPSS
jgi:hypothetical protein